MNDVLREAVSLFHSESIIRNIRVETNVTEPLPSVMMDKVLILQVLINLLMNAAESMALVRQVTGRSCWLRGRLMTTRCAWPCATLARIEAEELTKVFDPFLPRNAPVSAWAFPEPLNHRSTRRTYLAENNPDRGVTSYFDLPAVKDR